MYIRKALSFKREQEEDERLAGDQASLSTLDLDDFLNSGIWPTIPEPPAVSIPPPFRSTPTTPILSTSHIRHKEYEFGRAPQCPPRNKKKLTDATTKKKAFRIVNPFRPRYTKINNQRTCILSDSDEVENPDSIRNRRRRKFYRAVVLQQMMWRQLFPPVQTSLMQKPMQVVLKELADIACRKEFIQCYILPQIRGHCMHTVLNHIKTFKA